MASWVEIIALVIAIIALAGVIGLLIWYLIANGAAGQNIYTIAQANGDVKTFRTGGGNLVFINNSTAIADFALEIASDNSATTGKLFWIVNHGAGKLIAAGPTGSTVVFPATTLTAGQSANYILTANNTYVRMI